MNPQHTPAPWILGKPLPEENRIQIMHKEAPRPDDISPTWVVANVNLCMGEESKANAQLIAAAPELLSALQTCELELTALRQRLEGPEFAVIRTVILTALHQTRDAIAKATTNS